MDGPLSCGPTGGLPDLGAAGPWLLNSFASVLRGKVRDGMSFSKAVAATSPSFGNLFCALVSAGEASGLPRWRRADARTPDQAPLELEPAVAPVVDVSAVEVLADVEAEVDALELAVVPPAGTHAWKRDPPCVCTCAQTDASSQGCAALQ